MNFKYIYNSRWLKSLSCDDMFNFNHLNKLVEKYRLRCWYPCFLCNTISTFIFYTNIWILFYEWSWGFFPSRGNFEHKYLSQDVSKIARFYWFKNLRVSCQPPLCCRLRAISCNCYIVLLGFGFQYNDTFPCFGHQNFSEFF